MMGDKELIKLIKRLAEGCPDAILAFEATRALTNQQKEIEQLNDQLAVFQARLRLR